jgi:hypothetical protein
MENKEKQVINATETRTTFIPVESCTPITAYQCCLLCENTREVPCGYGSHYPWVCNECREAIAFVKDLRNSAKETKEVSEEKTKEIKASIALL